MTEGHETSAGSRARDHLANERTHLAWLRTAANVIVLGLAIAQFVGHRHGARAVLAGIVLVTTGLSGIVYGTVRYRRVNAELEEGRFVTGTRGREPTIAAAVLGAASVAALVLLFV